VRFEWDRGKAERNIRKHGVDFAEASTAFGDPFARIIDDPGYAQEERRFILLGRSEVGKLLIVVFTERKGDIIRIISARGARPREQRSYENVKE
jgi:uncharacterized DUF497 family protein